MSDSEKSMMIGLLGQWLLLVGYTVLFLCSLYTGYRISRLRPMVIAAITIAITHIVYYALFLVWPDVLDFNETMLFSILLRFQILFSIMAGLVLAIRRYMWRSNSPSS